MICHQPINRGISSFDIFYLKIYIYIYIYMHKKIYGQFQMNVLGGLKEMRGKGYLDKGSSSQVQPRI